MGRGKSQTARASARARAKPEPRRHSRALPAPATALGAGGWLRLQDELRHVWSGLSQIVQIDRRHFEELYELACGGVAVGAQRRVADVVTPAGQLVSLKTQLDEWPSEGGGAVVNFSSLGRATRIAEEAAARFDASLRPGAIDATRAAALVLADWNERYRDDCGELQRQIDSGELTRRAIKLKPAELRLVLLRGLRTDDTWTFRHYEWRIGDGIDPDRYLWRWAKKGRALVGSDPKTGARRWLIDINEKRLLFHAALETAVCLTSDEIEEVPREISVLYEADKQRTWQRYKREVRAERKQAIAALRRLRADFRTDVAAVLARPEGAARRRALTRLDERYDDRLDGAMHAYGEGIRARYESMLGARMNDDESERERDARVAFWFGSSRFMSGETKPYVEALRRLDVEIATQLARARAAL